MPFSRFDEELPLLVNDRDKQVGICVMGPVGAGDKIVWMSAWAWQQNGDEIAACTGDAGMQVKGARPLRGKDKPPFSAPAKPKWMVQAGFRKGSATFNPREPVLVQAIALIEIAGERAIVQWSQAVDIEHAY